MGLFLLPREDEKTSEIQYTDPPWSRPPRRPVINAQKNIEIAESRVPAGGTYDRIALQATAGATPKLCTPGGGPQTTPAATAIQPA
jgi:hypothetical protein